MSGRADATKKLITRHHKITECAERHCTHDEGGCEGGLPVKHLASTEFT